MAGLPSVPMNLADKYDQAALMRFLLDPVAHRPSGRMPNFKLSEAEAADLDGLALRRLCGAADSLRCRVGRARHALQH